jgi:hypothetical protein
MPRSLADIIRNADGLAQRAEAFEPDDASETTTPEMLVRRAAWKRDQAERDLANAIAVARDEHVPWRVIGKTLGTSPQAAQKRYSATIRKVAKATARAKAPTKRATASAAKRAPAPAAKRARGKPPEGRAARG